MRQVRTHAFAAPSAGVWLHPHELAALAGLPAWCIALLVALIKRSNYKTGTGRTGYGELINALTPDQPERGPRLWAPSRDDIKGQLARFCALRILSIDRVRSEQLQSLNFEVCPRVAQRVPKPKRPPELSPGSTEGKAPELPPGIVPGLTAVNQYNASATPPVDNLPEGPSPELRARLAAVGKRAGGRTRAPKGA